MKIKKRVLVSGVIASGVLILLPLSASARHNSQSQLESTNTSASSATTETENEHKVLGSQTTTTANTTAPTTVKSHEANDSDDDDKATTTTTGTPTDLAGATVIAKALHVGVNIVKTETEKEDGHTVFEFHFADGSRVSVDGSTSKVLRDTTGNSGESSDKNNSNKHDNN